MRATSLWPPPAEHTFSTQRRGHQDNRKALPHGTGSQRIVWTHYAPCSSQATRCEELCAAWHRLIIEHDDRDLATVH